MILHRTPYGIAAADARDKFDCHACLAAEPGRADARLDPARLAGHRRRTAMPRCTRIAAAGTARRARTGSMPTTRRTAMTRSTGSRRSPGRNGRVGMSGSSAGATTTFAAASTRHPSLRAFFAQAGGSSIYDDVVYEGQSIEMERLWLWVAQNIPGLSAVASRGGDAALRHRRGRAGRGSRAGGGALYPARRGAHRRAAVHRLGGLDAPAARRLSGFRDLAALPRRDHHAIRRRMRSAPGTISAARSTSPGFTSPAGSTSSRPA